MNASPLYYPKKALRGSKIDRVADACFFRWFVIIIRSSFNLRNCGYWGGILSGVVHCGTPQMVVNAI